MFLCCCCSAGVGRTGAFIALDYLHEQAEAEGMIDLFGLTARMRKDRSNMIQTVVCIPLLRSNNPNISYVPECVIISIIVWLVSCRMSIAVE